MTFKKIINTVLTAVCVSVLLVGCAEDDVEYLSAYEQYLIDVEIIEDYIAENDLDAYNVDSFGVYLAITEEGTIDTDLYPTSTSTVTCDYKGYLIDGTEFDSNESISFPLTSVITGWQIAFQELTVGDKATMLIPSYYGYGQSARGSIPANSVLIFDVELISFE